MRNTCLSGFLSFPRLTLQKASKANTQLTYNARGFLTQLKNINTFGSTTLSDFTLVYDPLGNIIQMSVNIPSVSDGQGHTLPADSGTVYYTYDNNGRLIEENSGRTAFYSGNYDYLFGWDAARRCRPPDQRQHLLSSH